MKKGNQYEQKTRNKTNKHTHRIRFNQPVETVISRSGDPRDSGDDGDLYAMQSTLAVRPCNHIFRELLKR